MVLNAFGLWSLLYICGAKRTSPRCRVAALRSVSTPLKPDTMSCFRVLKKPKSVGHRVFDLFALTDRRRWLRASNS